MCKYFKLIKSIGNTSFYFMFNFLFQNGPMATGLKPQEASDRLIMFQVIFLVSLTF